MRYDLLTGFRKWRFIGVLALVLIAFTAISTTVHAVQHVVSANASTINLGDTEACGLCHLETTVSSTPNLKTGVVLTGLPTYDCPALALFEAPLGAYFSHSLRGPPIAA